MVNPPVSESVPTLLQDTRARASRWGGQLGLLFGWLLVIEFGLMSVALGLLVADWPQTPEFLASAAGAWLLLLAGCRGLAAFAQSPSRSDTARRPTARLTSPLASFSSQSSAQVSGPASGGAGGQASAQPPVKQSMWTRSMNGQSPWSESARARQAGWTQPVRTRPGSNPASGSRPARTRDGRPGSASDGRPGSASDGRPGSAVDGRPGSASDGLRVSASDARTTSGSDGRSSSAVDGLFVPASDAAVAAASVPSGSSSAARRVAIVEVASCVGTGFVLLQADWPTRSAAVPIALAFAGVAVIVCAALDVLVARFSTAGYPRQRLIRAAGWLVSGLMLMILLRSSAPAALGTAAVLIGLVETGLGGWLLSCGVQERRAGAASDTLSMDDDEPDLAGAELDSTPDFWPWAVQSETA